MSRLSATVFPALAVDPLRLVRAPEVYKTHGSPAVFWAEPSLGGRARDVHIGWGAARTLRASGPSRFKVLQEALRGELASVDRAHHVRAFGGFAFLPGSAEEAPWRGYSDATFVIPRWTYRLTDGRAELVLVQDVADSDDGVAAELASLRAALAGCDEPRALSKARGELRAQEDATAYSEPSATRWHRYVSGLQQGIVDGYLSKVVAAQRTELAFAEPPDATAVLAGLCDRFAQTTCFAFRLPNGDQDAVSSVFLGATPEQLITVSGDRFETEALAGSISPDADRPVQSLLASQKDRDEHSFVVEDVRSCLAPLVSELHASDARVKCLPDVFHLHTVMEGRCLPGAHVLSFVEALHPTSAVGGVPREAALQAIREHEHTPRGWYAGPVGWVDGAGNGSFSVALRSGLLFGSQAWLYAGAGIVPGSDPASEYAETKLKRAAMLDALSPSGGAARTTPKNPARAVSNLGGPAMPVVAARTHGSIG